MREIIVDLEVTKAFAELKDVLVKNHGAIVSEEAPTKILVRQGSVWGISPKAAKKMVIFRLLPLDFRTKIVSSSSWTRDYKNLTWVGSVCAVALALICFWISDSLVAYVATSKPNFWSWLADTQGSIDLQRAQLFIDLNRYLLVFLSVTLILEIAVVVYAHSRIDAFAEESLRKLE